MSSHEKALNKKGTHKHKEKDGKCIVCNMTMGNEGKIDDKGKMPREQYKFNNYKGAKNNDTQ